jgi:SAM-dependent methyltransferase
MDELRDSPWSGYDARFFARFAEVEETHFWFAARRRIVAPLLAQAAAELPPGSPVVEIGCGTGGMLSLLAEVCGPKRVVGLDLFLEGLALARARHPVHLVQGDLQQSPFRPAGLLCMFDVLEHLTADEEVLRDLYGLLAPGGRLLLTVPAWPALWSYYDEAQCHRRRYRPAELATKLRAAGFTVEYLSPMLSGMLPPILLKRVVAPLAGRLRRGAPRPRPSIAERALADLLPPPAPVNALLARLLAWERPLVARRLRVPAGTSLLALARRPLSALS